MRIVSLIMALYSLLMLAASPATAERLRDLVDVQGVRDNPLIGYGLVVGLDGTGDQTTQTPFTTQSINNMLSQLGITITSGTSMQLKNVAAVMVTANYPAFARTGQKSMWWFPSLGSAKSLRGGTLIMTPMKGVDNQVYALAQGNLLVGGAGASAGGSQVKVNQLAGGRINGGAVIERELPTAFGANNHLVLNLKQEDFALAQRISDTINRQNRGGVARPLDSRTVEVSVAANNNQQVRFLSQIMDVNVDVGEPDAKVIHQLAYWLGGDEPQCDVGLVRRGTR